MLDVQYTNYVFCFNPLLIGMISLFHAADSPSVDSVQEKEDS